MSEKDGQGRKANNLFSTKDPVDLYLVTCSMASQYKSFTTVPLHCTTRPYEAKYRLLRSPR